MNKLINQRNKILSIENQTNQNENDLKNLNQQNIKLDSTLFTRKISEIIIYQGEITQNGGGGVGG